MFAALNSSKKRGVPCNRAANNDKHGRKWTVGREASGYLPGE